MVRRFEYVGGSYYMGQREDGDYVEYDDYAALESRVAELEKDAARYRKVRKGQCVALGDCYAMKFTEEGDSPVDGEELDSLIDKMRIYEA